MLARWPPAGNPNTATRFGSMPSCAGSLDRGNDGVCLCAMGVKGEDRVDAASRKTLNRIAADTATPAG